MLNPPLSLLSDDLFAYIVDHVAELPSHNEHLCSLSIAHRAFTWFCQAHIFKVLHLGDRRCENEDSISKHLEKMRNILDDKPSFANSVRVVSLSMSNHQNAWLFNNLTLISIFQLLAKLLMPSHKLRLFGRKGFFIFEERSVNSFPYLPQAEKNISSQPNEKDYDEYWTDGQCSGQELPTLDSLDYRESEKLIEQMVTLLPRFHTPVVLCSKLRVLTLCPYKTEMTCLQAVLDVACNTLEELYLTNKPPVFRQFNQYALACYLNLRDLSCLRVFALSSTIWHDAKSSVVLRDINLVLNTIPTSNKLSSLAFNFDFTGTHPFRECLEEDWVGLCNEIVHIARGKHLKLNVDVSTSWLILLDGPAAELYERVKEKMASLSEYPNICTTTKQLSMSGD